MQTFESPILIICGLIFGIYWWLQRKKYDNFQQVYVKFILSCVLFTLVEMSFLPKAPRGILFILPMLYSISFELLRIGCSYAQTYYKKVLYKQLITSIFIGFMAMLLWYNYRQLDRHIYAYTTTNYPKIVTYLEQHTIKKLAITVGINSTFFLPQTIDYQAVLFAKDLILLQKRGYEYCLVDAYYQVVGATSFEHVQILPAVLEVSEPTLFSPLLYLEHCEFTGSTFEEALQTQEQVLKAGTQLRLVRLRDTL